MPEDEVDPVDPDPDTTPDSSIIKFDVISKDERINLINDQKVEEP